jgi:hypothetical protein
MIALGMAAMVPQPADKIEPVPERQSEPAVVTAFPAALAQSIVF